MDVKLTYTAAQATRAEKCLRDYYPWNEVEDILNEDDEVVGSKPLEDTRTVATLIKQFTDQHLGQLIISKEGEVAKAALSAW